MISKTDQYFLTIARLGNLNKAAEKLYVSQPALSRYVQRLEQALGTQLFDRSANSMKLNASGALYLEYLLNSMEEEQKLFHRLQEINQMMRGVLRLGIPSFCGQCYLPKVLPAFSSEFPHVKVTLYEETGDVIEQALVNQEIDLAVLHPPILSENLSYQPLLRERILLAVKREPGVPDTRVIQEGTIELVRNSPTIMPQNDQKLGQVVNDFYSRINCRPHIYTRTQNVTTTLTLVSVGLGIGFVPESGLDTVSDAILNALDFYSFDSYLSDWRLAAVTRKNSSMSVYAKRFLELLRQCQRKRAEPD